MDTNHPTYNKIDNTFERVMNEINKFEKVFKQGGQLEMAVMEIDGDPSYLKDVAQALAGLYDALEDAHFGTIGHVVDDRGAKDDVHPAHQGEMESVQENKKQLKKVYLTVMMKMGLWPVVNFTLWHVMQLNCMVLFKTKMI